MQMIHTNYCAQLLKEVTYNFYEKEPVCIHLWPHLLPRRG